MLMLDLEISAVTKVALIVGKVIIWLGIVLLTLPPKYLSEKLT